MSLARVQADAAGGATITSEAGAQPRLALVVQPLAVVRREPAIKAYGRVLNPAALVALVAELASARVALENAPREFGEGLDLLDRKAQEIYRVLAKIPGAADVQMEIQPGAPEVNVGLRRDRLRALGFQPVEVFEAAQTGYQGVKVAQTYEGNRVVDVVVIQTLAERQDPEGLGGLVLRNAQSARVPLRELAEITPTAGRSTILREGVRRGGAGCIRRGRGGVHRFVGWVHHTLWHNHAQLDHDDIAF